MNQSTKRKILAIGAHPDDLEFGMGAVLLQEVAAGAECSLVITSRGEAGSSGTPEERETEAREAAAQLEAAGRIRFLDFGGDGQQAATPAHASELARVIREVRPSVVFAPSLCANQHPDHAAVGRTARDACRLARYGGLEPLRGLPKHAVDSLWFYAVTPTPEASLASAVLFDVSEQVDAWQALMGCHRTQLASRGYLDLQLSRARQLGLMAGCGHAIALWPNDPPVLRSIGPVAQTARGF